MSLRISQYRAIANQGDNVVKSSFDKDWNQHVTTAPLSFKGKVVHFLQKIPILNRTKFVRKHLRKERNEQITFLRTLAYTYGNEVALQVNNKLHLGSEYLSKTKPLTARKVALALELANTRWNELHSSLRETPFSRDTFDPKAEAERLSHKYPVATPQQLEAAMNRYATNRVYEGMSRFLTPDQFAALTLYTSSLYKDINHDLRTGENAERWGAFVNDAQEAIAILEKAKDRITPSSSAVYRGINATKDLPIHPDNLAEGQVISDKTFTSTSRDIDEAEDFAALGPQVGEDPATVSQTGDQILQYIFGKTGADIDNISAEQYESEMIFAPETEFKILFKHYDEHAKVYRMVLEERGEQEKSGSTGVAEALLDAPVKNA
ncbi:MAG: ADP-ribosyltransferase domain-containing protein [Desulfovibrionales bacterium]|nr:ADP-ribosyltransferase domain-containing protein [Desulfovibrionales bacterium]